MNNQYDDLVQALTDLDKKGYNMSFRLTPNGLSCGITSKAYDPENVNIVASHRFEGDTNLNDMAILYVIETTDGCKGVLIDAFGTYADTELGEFLKRVNYQVE